jgi:LacI family transcriptional regulator, purine nucleotide synthesis repressor
MKTIMQDIAKIAGVSPGTVSNALNNRKGVGKDTKEKIIKIAEELGYYRSSNKDESKAIRFIIYKKHGYVVSDTPFFSALIEGIERECRAEGYEMLVSHIFCNEDNDEDVREIIKQEQVAGVLILATEMEEADLEPFRQLSVPVILLDSYFKNADFDHIVINNTQGAYQAARYLIEQGHVRIGCLRSSKPINNFNYRYEGYKEALTEENLVGNNDYELMLEPTLEGAYRDMKAILEKGDKKLPTAYFADNDIIALGAIRAMREFGISVPEQVSIIGFDDMPFCEISNPGLTTVRVYKQYIGKTAVRRLIQKLEDNDELKLKIEIKTDIIQRGSVKKI